MDFKKTNITFNRSIFSYGKIQNVLSLLIRNKKYQLVKISKLQKRLLNVGCGANISDNFVNIDYQWREGLDLCWDITNGIPLSTESFKGIYTEHCLEHIVFDKCQLVLDEFYRLLENGGTLRLIVPDAELYINLYFKSQQGELVDFPYVSKDNIVGVLTPMAIVNSIFRDHGHLFAYDFRTLSEMLKKSGFKIIKRVEFMKGSNPELLVDSEHRKAESLYIEAIK